MKKEIKILLIILGVIIILGLIFFAVDYNRVQKQETPIFCINYSTLRDDGTKAYIGLGYKVIDFNMLNGYNEMKIGSWIMQYEDFEGEYSTYTKKQLNSIEETVEKNIDEQKVLEEIPQEYSMQQAIKDGCVVISYNAVFNKSKLDSFITNTNANNENRQSDFIRIVLYTNEGDPIITDLEYKKDDGYILTYDNTRDTFGADTKVTTYDDIPSNIYTIDLVENENFINIGLVLQGVIDYDSDMKEYKPLLVANYSKDLTTYDTAPSFIGEVTDVNEKMLTVNSEDRSIGDVVWVRVDDTSEYKVGEKIEVFYTGMVLETYPCQIYEIDIRKIYE